jgi:c-di-GMP-binding flagellar brake protein YcgR
MIGWILIGVLFLLLLTGAAFLRRAGGGNFPWVSFYAKGKESGFSFSEVNLLRKVAVENRLKNPTSLFWSISQLDRSIRGMIIKFRSENRINEPASQQFLSKLFDFRKNVEFDLPKYKLGIKSTRKLPHRQRMTINVPGVGAFTTQIAENLRRYMAISYPEGPKLPVDFSWKGQRINVYFWRQDDAGYVFESRVLDDFYEQKYPILHIAHSDSLVRSQKRRSIRVATNFPANLYPLKSIDSATEITEKRRGLRCRVRDISEDGAAVLIGGRAKVGMPLKIQFKLSDSTLAMPGVIKGVNHNENKNQSVLHIQSKPLSPPTRNRILMYVYDIFGERTGPDKRKKNRF